MSREIISQGFNQFMTKEGPVVIDYTYRQESYLAHELRMTQGINGSKKELLSCATELSKAVCGLGVSGRNLVEEAEFQTPQMRLFDEIGAIREMLSHGELVQVQAGERVRQVVRKFARNMNLTDDINLNIGRSWKLNLNQVSLQRPWAVKDTQEQYDVWARYSGVIVNALLHRFK
ncbi:MAG: hypothetical protein KBC00_03780 [Candidatus Levybacteria bacterium]|nr:hypothetical protein [Candidatus Levybacteria bacterium]MBP9814924.1 hypothetical protein [Candidatus Levybacteria bacterium]